MDMQEIISRLMLNENASTKEIRDKLVEVYEWHSSIEFLEDHCWNEQEQYGYILHDEYLIEDFNKLVSEEDKIDI